MKSVYLQGSSYVGRRRSDPASINILPSSIIPDSQTLDSWYSENEIVVGISRAFCRSIHHYVEGDWGFSIILIFARTHSWLGRTIYTVRYTGE